VKDGLYCWEPQSFLWIVKALLVVHMGPVLPSFLMRFSLTLVPSFAYILVSYDFLEVWRSHDESSFTGSMTVSYRKMVPVGSTQAFEAKIVRQDGRKSFVAGKLMSCDGKVIFAEATGVWIQSQQLDSISRRSHL